MVKTKRGGQHKANADFAQTRSKTVSELKASEAMSGLSGPSETLEKIIRLVNLVPKGVVLPIPAPFAVADEDEIFAPQPGRFEEKIQTLPPRLAAHLMRFLELEGPIKGRLSVYSEYYRIHREREILYSIIQLIQTDEIANLRECQICCQIFLAAGKRQIFCPTRPCALEAKRRRQKRWEEKYEEDHGQPYKPRTREPRRRGRVRKALEAWGIEEPFNPTNENMKTLAAEADVTLRQCQAEYAVLLEERKRAKTSG